MNSIITEKTEIYSTRKKKLKIALQNGFYLEAVMLEYAIINNVLSYMVFAANLYPLQSLYNDTEVPFDEKISKLNEAYKNRRLVTHLWTGLTEDIEEWNIARKSLIRNQYEQIYGTQAAVECAAKGDVLVQRIIISAKKIKRALGIKLDMKE